MNTIGMWRSDAACRTAVASLKPPIRGMTTSVTISWGRMRTISSSPSWPSAATLMRCGVGFIATQISSRTTP